MATWQDRFTSSHALWSVSAVLLGLSCYFNSLRGELVHDDVFAIKENGDILPSTPLSLVFSNDFWGEPMRSVTSHKSYRPLTVLTFRLNYLLHGLEPWGYHLTNLLLHLVATVLFGWLCRWVVFGEEPERVFAAQQLGLETDDAASIVLVFAGGRTAQISVGFNAFSSQYAEISGHRGMLRLDQVWNNENRAVAIEHRTPSGVEVVEFPPCFQFALQLQHLCECLAEGREHRIAPEHSVAQMRVLDAVKESMETGRAVELAHS